MEKKILNPKFNENSIVPSSEGNITIINENKEKEKLNKINNNYNKDNNTDKNNINNNLNSIKDNSNNIKDYDVFDDIYLKYNSLFNDNILGRFSVLQKINIINKLNIILFNKIKKELQLQLKRKQLENELLKIRNSFKDKLIKKKKLYSLIQEKMLRDYNIKRKLKDLRKKLMDERISALRYKNLTYIMKSYGIYNEDKYFR